jgi:hypothetical protein
MPLETSNINAVEIFSTGRWNSDVYTDADLDAMIEAFDKVGFEPPVKAGHQDGQEKPGTMQRVFGVPALGYVSRVYRVGSKLLADLKDVPRKFADLIKAGSYKRISSEVYWSYKDEASGKTYPRVLKAVAFLGADIPALTNLRAIESLYKKTAAGLLYSYDDAGREFHAYEVAPVVPKKMRFRVEESDGLFCIIAYENENDIGTTMQCYQDKSTADQKCAELNEASTQTNNNNEEAHMLTDKRILMDYFFADTFTQTSVSNAASDIMKAYMQKNAVTFEKAYDDLKQATKNELRQLQSKSYARTEPVSIYERKSAGDELTEIANEKKRVEKIEFKEAFRIALNENLELARKYNS